MQQIKGNIKNYVTAGYGIESNLNSAQESPSIRSPMKYATLENFNNLEEFSLI
jgi:hypothetical protein